MISLSQNKKNINYIEWIPSESGPLVIQYGKVKLDTENILLEAIRAPYNMILKNAGLISDTINPIEFNDMRKPGEGTDVITGKTVNMVKNGIIDPVLVTKKALINAVSVATTIISADCVISNVRDYASS